LVPLIHIMGRKCKAVEKKMGQRYIHERHERERGEGVGVKLFWNTRCIGMGIQVIQALPDKSVSEVQKKLCFMIQKRGKKDPKNHNKFIKGLSMLPLCLPLLSFLSLQPNSFLLTTLWSHTKTLLPSLCLETKVGKGSWPFRWKWCLELVLAICQIANSKEWTVCVPRENKGQKKEVWEHSHLEAHLIMTD